MGNKTKLIGEKYNKFLSILLSEDTFCFYVIACMIAVPLTELIAEFNGQQLWWEMTTFTVFSLVGLFLCSAKIALYPTGKHWSDIFFFTLHIFMFLSLIFSCDIMRIYRTNSTTNEYPQFFVGYYCMMFAGFQLSSVKSRKRVLYTFLSLAFVEGIISSLQTYKIRIMPVLWGWGGGTVDTTHAYGLTQNANLWGGLSVLFLGAVAGAFIFSQKKAVKIALGVLMLIIAYSSYGSMSRLAWVGDLVIIFSFLISLLIMKKRNKGNKDYNKYLISLAIVVGIVAVAVGVSFINPDSFAATKFSQISTDIQGTTSGSSRGYLWYFALSSVKNHWVTGVGIDNLRWCFSENIHWFSNMHSSNQAHNEYIQVLATQGVFALANYLLLLIITTVRGIKRVLTNEDEADRKLTWIYLMMFAGYAAASFFLFRSFNVVMYFFLTIGLVDPRKHDLELARR